MNHLKAEVTATEFWREQIATLKDVGDLLKKQLPDIKPEQNTDSGKRERPSAGGSGLWAFVVFMRKRKVMLVLPS